MDQHEFYNKPQFRARKMQALAVRRQQKMASGQWPSRSSPSGAGSPYSNGNQAASNPWGEGTNQVFMGTKSDGGILQARSKKLFAARKAKFAASRKAQAEQSLKTHCAVCGVDQTCVKACMAHAKKVLGLH